MLYRAWAEGWGPKFYKVGDAPHHPRARLEWQHERETATTAAVDGRQMAAEPPSDAAKAEASAIDRAVDEDREIPAVAPRRHREEIRFFTVAEVAERLGVSTRTIRRWIENKELVAHRFGRAVRIAENDLKAFLAMHRDV
jgi:excisionase family DNA binding protein